jgi:hypothetical protein
MLPVLLDIVSGREQLFGAISWTRTGAERTRIGAEPQSDIVHNDQAEEGIIESTHMRIKLVVVRDCRSSKVMKFGVDLAKLESLVVRMGR